MSQRNVEWVVGRLVTDEAFRHRFAADAQAALAEMSAAGCELTPCEARVLAALDPAVVERCAGELDPRLLKADLAQGGFWHTALGRHRCTRRKG